MSSFGFGLDIAGYSSGKSVLAAARSDGATCKVTLLRDCPFSRKAIGDDALALIVRREADALEALTKRGCVYIDAPIDLQNLLKPTDPTYVWELTMRPVDRLVGGLPALADKIGAPTARVANILKAAKLTDAIGTSIFETYPAASLAVMGLQAKGYKGEGNVAALMDIGSKMRISSDVIQNDDDLDAVICALTAIAPAAFQLRGDNLKAHFASKAAKLPHHSAIPESYVLLRDLPFRDVHVSKCDFATWLNSPN